MSKMSRMRKNCTIIILLGGILAGCGISSSSNQLEIGSPTPTPTNQGGMVASESPSADRCEGLAGYLELQILVGPAEAVGLEPVTIGEIPFNIVQDGDSYQVEGGGPLESYSDVLTAEWGTYTVTFEGDTSVSGECISSDDTATLTLLVEMTGDQNVEIIYEGTQMNYPWSGTNQIQASLPVVEGAQQTGEGWILILHLN